MKYCHSIKIRPYRAQDAAHIDRLAIDAFSEYRDKYTDWAIIAASVGKMSSLAVQAEILVAEEEGQVVGAVALAPPGIGHGKNIDPDWALLRMLVVSPRHRSRGIGKRLAIACMNLAAKKGFNTVGLYTSPIMLVALPMYLRMGFEKVRDIEPICGVAYSLYKLDIQAFNPSGAE